MPANDGDHDSMTALRRMLRLFSTWRRRRAARRRADLQDFMGMSDRTLADIGVRRADLQAASAGMMPARHIARTHGGAPWTAPVRALHPRSRRRAEAGAAPDLSAAA